MSAIQGQSKALLIAEELERLIQMQDLATDDRLGTRASLQQRFGVARATINEAIKILHDRGRITAKSGPGGGVFIAEPDASVQMGRFLVSIAQEDLTSIAHAIELRDHLEYLVLRHAAEFRTLGDVDELWEIYARFERRQHQSATAQIALVWELHSRIAAITPNTTLQATYLGLLAYVRANVDDRSSTNPDEHARFVDDRLASHRRLIEVIRDGDPDATEAAVRAHNQT